MLLSPCDRHADPVFFFSLSFHLFSSLTVWSGLPPLCCVDALKWPRLFPAWLFRGNPTDEFSSHSSDSNMSHRVSPCRASSWFRTRRCLSPTCCVCLPAATCTTSVSNSPLQVRISSTQTAAGLRLSVLLTLEVYEIDLEIFFFSAKPDSNARRRIDKEESVFLCSS